MSDFPTPQQMRSLQEESDKKEFEELKVRCASEIRSKYTGLNNPFSFVISKVGGRVKPHIEKFLEEHGWRVKFEEQSDQREGSFVNVTLTSLN